MKNKFIMLIAALLLASQSQSQGNVGIGTTAPMAQLSVGSSSQFRVNSTGNIIRINNVVYSFPAAQGTNQYLKNDGAGNLTWAPAAKPVIRVFSMVANGFADAWLVDDPADYNSGINADPNLVLHRGFTYQFANNSGGHPLYISLSVGGAGYGPGVSNNGTTSGIITFTVPMDAPATLWYYCASHNAMAGTLTIQ